MFEVALARPEEAAANLYPDPLVLMLRSVKSAFPFVADFEMVPERVPPEGLAARFREMLALESVTTLPPASSIETSTAGEMSPPPEAFVG